MTRRYFRVVVCVPLVRAEKFRDVEIVTVGLRPFCDMGIVLGDRVFRSFFCTDSIAAGDKACLVMFWMASMSLIEKFGELSCVAVVFRGEFRLLFLGVVALTSILSQ